MRMHQECVDLTHDDSDRSAYEASNTGEVDLTINSDDDQSGHVMDMSPARLIADNSLPSTNPGDNEFFNLITLPINMESRGVKSRFWVVVGGEHTGDIVDSLDEATLRTTATTLIVALIQTQTLTPHLNYNPKPNPNINPNRKRSRDHGSEQFFPILQS
jgi:hypothetical protein